MKITPNVNEQIRRAKIRQTVRENGYQLPKKGDHSSDGVYQYDGIVFDSRSAGSPLLCDCVEYQQVANSMRLLDGDKNAH